MSPPRPPFDAELAPIQAGIPHPAEPLSKQQMVAYHNDPSLYGPLPGVDDLIAGRPITHTEHAAPGFLPSDPAVLLSIFTPSSSSSSSRPCIYFIHGGGMVFLNRLVGLEQPLDWLVATGCVLVTVEYRLAPEHPQPALLHDCRAGLEYVHAHAAELGVDASRILLAGHSGGSGLAAGLALSLRDDAAAVSPIGQLLACPMLDDRCDSLSCLQFADEEPWDRTSSLVAWDAVMNGLASSPALEKHSDSIAYFAPARARDLSRLPEAWIDVGSAEVFRDEAVAYASRLWAAGVQAELHVWPGGFHGFDVMAPESRLAKRVAQAKLEWIIKVLRIEAL